MEKITTITSEQAARFGEWAQRERKLKQDREYSRAYRARKIEDMNEGCVQ